MPGAEPQPCTDHSAFYIGSGTDQCSLAVRSRPCYQYACIHARRRRTYVARTWHQPTNLITTAILRGVQYWRLRTNPPATSSSGTAAASCARAQGRVIQAGEGESESTGATRVCSLVGTLAPTGCARGGGSPAARERGAPGRHGPAKLRLRGLDPVPNPGARGARAPGRSGTSHQPIVVLCSAAWADGWRNGMELELELERRMGRSRRTCMQCRGRCICTRRIRRWFVLNWDILAAFWHALG